MATIIVGAYMVRYPLGGMMSWVFQHLAGFKALGHTVYFVEKYGYSNSCFNPATRSSGNDCSYGLKMVNDLLSTVGLEENWCFVDHEGNYFGMSQKKIESAFKSADYYIDLGTQNGWEEESSHCRYRVLIDGEPGFSQISFFNDDDLGRRYSRYDHFFTNGYNIGRTGNTVPTGEVVWKHMYSPVHANAFNVREPDSRAPFTTVMNWQSHKPVSYNGCEYGQKDIEFEKFVRLPSLVNANLEVAITGRNIPLDRLKQNKWNRVNGIEITKSYQSFCEYVERAKAEFSVCKNVFVALNTGWFSDKSAVFLAAGRPVVLQDTGFSEHLPCGIGLFAVKNEDEARSAIEEIETDWSKHSKAARDIAINYLDTTIVLQQFMQQIDG